MEEPLLEFVEERKEQTMTSQELADIVGKQHKHVMEDVRKFAAQNNIDFTIKEYFDMQNKHRPYYEIPIELVGILNMRYGNEILSGRCGHVYVKEKERTENLFANALSGILSVYGIEIKRQYKVGKFRVDFYLPKYKLAIEYDESQHSIVTHLYNDKQRQEYIENVIGCKFIRVLDTDDMYINIGKVLKHILRKR